MARLALLSFRDVVVSPFTDLPDSPGPTYHRGGPRWPDWDHQTVARQCRYGIPDDVEPPAVEPTARLDGTVAWGGAITTQFGHQIADFSTRLLPTLAEMPTAHFAYSMHQDLAERFRSWEGTPGSYRDLLGWYVIGRDRVELITEPTVVERLVVAPQGEQYYGPNPESWYLDLLDAHVAERLGNVDQSGSLYVSRAGLRARFAGESYLETVFAEVGFRVLRPEAVPLEDQVRAYAGAESLVFAGGSAIHGVQLIGRGLGDVTVVGRRQQGSGRPGEVPLTARARSLRYVDAVRGVVHGRNIYGEPSDALGITILDPDLLLAALPLGGAWDEKAFEEAVKADVEEWIETERASRRWNVPGSQELVAETMRAAGLATGRL